MKLKFKKLKAHKSNFSSGRRSKSSIKHLVEHFTGNAKDTAKNNCLYFQNPNRHASAHYFIDGGEFIYKSVPVTSVAWSVGGFFTQKGGAGKFYKKCTNSNSLSIEMCNSVGGVPSAVYKQDVELTKKLMKKYHIPDCRVIRHWDVNGKECPEPWIGKYNRHWENFKDDIVPEYVRKLTTDFKEGKFGKKVVIREECPIRTGRGKAYKKVGTLKTGDRVEVLYILKAKSGNLWGSIYFKDKIRYICMNNCKKI